MLITGTCASLSLLRMSAASCSIIPCVGRRLASTRLRSDSYADGSMYLNDSSSSSFLMRLMPRRLAIGELDEDDADVVDHRQQHLAEVFRLAFFSRGKRDGANLGHAFDDVRDVFAELLADLLGRDERVFH